MPNVFNLIRKSNPGAPIPAIVIDDELRAHLEARPDPKNWFHGWYDTIGLDLACGRTFAQLIEAAKDKWRDGIGENDPGATRYWHVQLQILEWLDANFTVSAYAYR